MTTLGRKLKAPLWRFYISIVYKLAPYHPQIRAVFRVLRLTKHGERQPFLLGHIKSSKQLEEFAAAMVRLGFDPNDHPAWVDEGEVLGMRRLDGNDFQYHLRIFKDGEVRGHYEVTPESKPIAHMRDKYTEARTEQFGQWLQDWVILDSGKTISHSAPAPSRTDPEKG